MSSALEKASLLCNSLRESSVTILLQISRHKGFWLGWAVGIRVLQMGCRPHSLGALIFLRQAPIQEPGTKGIGN